MVLGSFIRTRAKAAPTLAGGTIPSVDDGGDSSLHLPFASTASTQNCARTIECSRGTGILNLLTYRALFGIGSMTRYGPTMSDHGNTAPF